MLQLICDAFKTGDDQLLFIGALKVPSLVVRYGNLKVLVSGLSLVLLGVGGLLCVDHNSSYTIGIALPMLGIGFGQGLAMSPLTNLGICQVARSDTGSASGMVNIAHQIGGAFGLSFMV